MCVFLLFIVVPILVIFLLPFIALGFGATAVSTAIQKKKLGDDKTLHNKELNQRVATQVGFFFFFLLCVFIGSLVVRYLMT